jgi:hypothetical protein
VSGHQTVGVTSVSGFPSIHCSRWRREPDLKPHSASELGQPRRLPDASDYLTRTRNAKQASCAQSDCCYNKCGRQQHNREAVRRLRDTSGSCFALLRGCHYEKEWSVIDCAHCRPYMLFPAVDERNFRARTKHRSCETRTSYATRLPCCLSRNEQRPSSALLAQRHCESPSGDLVLPRGGRVTAVVRATVHTTTRGRQHHVFG